MSQSIPATLKDEDKATSWKNYFSKLNPLTHPARKSLDSNNLNQNETAGDPIQRPAKMKSPFSTPSNYPNTPSNMSSSSDRRPTPETTNPKKDVNFFASSLVIEGSVRADSDMVIEGTIHGNVTCKSNIDLLGEIKGDVSGKTIRIRQGKSKEISKPRKECISMKVP